MTAVLRLGERVAYRYYMDTEKTSGVVLGFVTALDTDGIHVGVLRSASPYASAFWRYSEQRNGVTLNSLIDLKVGEWASLETNHFR